MTGKDNMKKLFKVIMDAIELSSRVRAATHLSRMGRYQEAAQIMNHKNLA